MPSKKYNKARTTCQVTFELPSALGASSARVCGDFNDWGSSAGEMKRGRDGGFKLLLRLPADRAYRYRFLLDGERWENDWAADRYEPNEFGSDDGVLEL